MQTSLALRWIWAASAPTSPADSRSRPARSAAVLHRKHPQRRFRRVDDFEDRRRRRLGVTGLGPAPGSGLVDLAVQFGVVGQFGRALGRRARPISIETARLDQRHVDAEPRDLLDQRLREPLQCPLRRVVDAGEPTADVRDGAVVYTVTVSLGLGKSPTAWRAPQPTAKRMSGAASRIRRVVIRSRSIRLGRWPPGRPRWSFIGVSQASHRMSGLDAGSGRQLLNGALPGVPTTIDRWSDPRTGPSLMAPTVSRMSVGAPRYACHFGGRRLRNAAVSAPSTTSAGNISEALSGAPLGQSHHVVVIDQSVGASDECESHVCSIKFGDGHASAPSLPRLRSRSHAPACRTSRTGNRPAPRCFLEPPHH